MRIKRILLATTALALIAGAQEAQAGGLYVSVFGGANWVTDSSANFTTTDSENSSTTTFYRWNTDADTGFVLGGAVGTHLDKWAKGLRVELEASYRRNDLSGAWATTTTDGPNTSTGPIDANLSTFALMANVWYECDMGWKVRPYVGGGAGWARAKLDGAVLTGDGSDTADSFDTSNDGFAWQLGVGFNYEAMPGVDVGLGYRYFDGPDFIEPFAVDAVFGGKGLQSFGRVDNNSHSVMVNLNVDIN